MKYTTKHIFIDTNIIEGNNFFHGSHFQSLLYYSRIGIIKLFMTSISRMELINRMKKRLIEAKAEHNKLVKSLNKPKTRILKNFIQYNEIELSPIKIEETIDMDIKPSPKGKSMNKELIDIMGGDMEFMVEGLTTRKGEKSSPTHIMGLNEWNLPAGRYFHFLEQNNLLDKMAYLSNTKRVSNYCLEGERGFISHVDGGGQERYLEHIMSRLKTVGIIQ